MQITLEGPYKTMYRLAYLIVANEGRRNVALYNSQSDRTTVSYARYRMTVLLNKLIPEGMEVDHIDDNSCNDADSNLQLLTKAQNLAKQNKLKRKMIHGSLACYRYCKCDICKHGRSLYNKGNKKEYYALISSGPIA